LHGAIYAARPDINSVLCAGSEDVLPFSITPTPLCAIIGTVGDMGTYVPVWDIAESFGEDTDLQVSSIERARDLAQRLGDHRVVLRRGVGFVTAGRTLNDAVKTSVYIPKNARALAQSLEFGAIRSISQGEVNARLAIDPESNAMRRGWEYWARQAGCERWL
jgi:HCOMODA/2-hydroxy-3-carboxy-muconic semialdehyde decarboxylase